LVGIRYQYGLWRRNDPIQSINAVRCVFLVSKLNSNEIGSIKKSNEIGDGHVGCALGRWRGVASGGGERKSRLQSITISHGIVLGRFILSFWLC